MSEIGPEHDSELPEAFEQRKKDHLELALRGENQAIGNGLDRVELVHEAIPDFNFSQIELRAQVFGHETKTPFLVSSMTGGHGASPELNRVLAEVCQERGWVLGVGSQRREMDDSKARSEWREIREKHPDLILLGNLGISQVIHTPIEILREVLENMGAQGLIIHCNPLQEALQMEGTPEFKGAWAALELLVKELRVPIVVKETGCGFSGKTMRKLAEVGISAVDVSGLGGTHWGRIEGCRNPNESLRARAAKTFSTWGISTAESLEAAMESRLKIEVWGSGGLRSGLDGAKCLAMGASRVGYAQPVLESALQGPESLNSFMEQMEFELRVAMFCTGSRTLHDLRSKGAFRWRKT